MEAHSESGSAGGFFLKKDNCHHLLSQDGGLQNEDMMQSAGFLHR